MKIGGAAIAGLLLVPALAFAQGPVSTASNTGTSGSDVIDLSWNAAVNGGSPYSAFVLNRAGGTPGVFGWIGASASGTLPGGSADGVLSRFLYSYTTTFNGGAVSGITYQCALDDVFRSVVLNGTTVSTAGCDQYNPSTTFTLSGFNTGSNTLTFNTGGNGVTDGFLLHVTSYTQSSTVPEPGSLGFLATGLVSLAGVARTRRSGRARR